MARNVVIRIALGVIVALFADTAMNARDLGQWDDPANADLKKWYQDLKQPDKRLEELLIALVQLRTAGTSITIMPAQG
jgi:hypothetical protein